MTETMATTLVVYWLAHIYRYRAGTPRGQCDAPAQADLGLRQERVRHPGVRDASGHRGERPDRGRHIALGVRAVRPRHRHRGACPGGAPGRAARRVHGWRLSAEALSAAIMGGILAALLVSLHRH